MQSGQRRLLHLARHMSGQGARQLSHGGGAAAGGAKDDFEILSGVSKGLGTIVLNRPKSLNALTLNMVRTLDGLFAAYAADPKVRVVVMKGAGNKAFCAGGDVVSVRKAVLEGGWEAGKHGHPAADFFREEYTLNYRIFKLEKPQVSIWDGFVMGGGVGVSIGSAFRVATEKTVFAMPETGIGFFPDVGGMFWLPRLQGGLGSYVGLTGARLGPADLLYSGIATHYVPSDRVPELESTLATVVGRFKGEDFKPSDLYDALNERLVVLTNETAPDPHAGKLAQNREEIDAVFGEADSIEEVMSRLEGRRSGWAKETQKLLSRVSPTSLKVTFRGMREGKDAPLEETFPMEYRMSQGFMTPDGDFVEGVRALLVDKDNKPQWKPPTLAEVTDDYVDKFFKPLDGDRDLQLPEV